MEKILDLINKGKTPEEIIDLLSEKFEKQEEYDELREQLKKAQMKFELLKNVKMDEANQLKKKEDEKKEVELKKEIQEEADRREALLKEELKSRKIDVFGSAMTHVKTDTGQITLMKKNQDTGEMEDLIEKHKIPQDQAYSYSLALSALAGVTGGNVQKCLDEFVSISKEFDQENLNKIDSKILELTKSEDSMRNRVELANLRNERDQLSKTVTGDTARAAGTGSNLIPETFVPVIMDFMYDESQFIKYLMTMTDGASSNTLLSVADKFFFNAVSGVNAYFRTGDTVAYSGHVSGTTETEPQFDETSITLDDMGGFFNITSRLLEMRRSDIIGAITSRIGQAFARRGEQYMIEARNGGTGETNDGLILSDTQITRVIDTAGTGYASLTLTNATDLEYSLANQENMSPNDFVWLGNYQMLRTLQRLPIGASDARPVLDPNGFMNRLGASKILSYDAVYCKQIALYDVSQAAAADKVTRRTTGHKRQAPLFLANGKRLCLAMSSPRIAVSDQVSFTSDVITYRYNQRFGFSPLFGQTESKPFAAYYLQIAAS